jgi:peptidoglycan/LPS O-acetylase OafA/YrhL
VVAVSCVVFSAAAVTPLAWASWRFVELPAMNRRSLPKAIAVDGPLLVAGKV